MCYTRNGPLVRVIRRGWGLSGTISIRRDLQLEARGLCVKRKPGSVACVRMPALAVRSMARPWISPRTPEPQYPQLHKPATNSLSAILPSPESKPTLICQSRPIPSHNLSNVTLFSCCYAVLARRTRCPSSCLS
jgi:hypothetical protein